MRPRPSTRRPSTRTWPSSSATRSPRSSSPRTTSRWPRSSTTSTSCRWSRSCRSAGKADHELVLTWAEFRDLGRAYLAEHPTVVDDAIAATGPDTLATLIYTSGTTGRPKGVRLAQTAWTYEGAAIEAYDIISPDDLQYLWLPLSPRLRQGADRHPAQDRLHHRRRRHHREDRGQPRCGQADVHGRRAADLREGPGEGDDRRPVRGQGQDLRLGVLRRPQDDSRTPRGPPADRAARRAVRPRRQAGVQQAQGPDGRQHQVLRLRLGGAEPRGAGVVLRRRSAGAGGLRPDRDQCGDLREQPAGHPVRDRRPGGARHRGPDRRGRRDPGPGRRGDAWLPRQRRGHRRGAQRRRLVLHRRHR